MCSNLCFFNFVVHKAGFYAIIGSVTDKIYGRRPARGHLAKLLSGCLPLPGGSAFGVFGASRAGFQHSGLSGLWRRHRDLQGRRGRNHACFCHRAGHFKARDAGGGGQLRQLWRRACGELRHHGAPLHSGGSQHTAHYPASAPAKSGRTHCGLRQRRPPGAGTGCQRHRRTVQRLFYQLFFQ